MPGRSGTATAACAANARAPAQGAWMSRRYCGRSPTSKGTAGKILPGRRTGRWVRIAPSFSVFPADRARSPAGWGSRWGRLPVAPTIDWPEGKEDAPGGTDIPGTADPRRALRGSPFRVVAVRGPPLPYRWRLVPLPPPGRAVVDRGEAGAHVRAGQPLQGDRRRGGAVPPVRLSGTDGGDPHTGGERSRRGPARALPARDSEGRVRRLFPAPVPGAGEDASGDFRGGRVGHLARLFPGNAVRPASVCLAESHSNRSREPGAGDLRPSPGNRRSAPRNGSPPDPGSGRRDDRFPPAGHPRGRGPRARLRGEVRGAGGGGHPDPDPPGGCRPRCAVSGEALPRSSRDGTGRGGSGPGRSSHGDALGPVPQGVSPRRGGKSDPRSGGGGARHDRTEAPLVKGQGNRPPPLLEVPGDLGDFVAPVGHLAVPADEDVRGNADHAVFPRDAAAFVQQDREGDLLSLDEGPHLLPALHVVQREDRERIPCRGLRVHPVDGRNRLVAVGAPGGPEDEEHRLLSDERTQGHLAAARLRQGEVDPLPVAARNGGARRSPPTPPPFP